MGEGGDSGTSCPPAWAELQGWGGVRGIANRERPGNPSSFCNSRQAACGFLAARLQVCGGNPQGWADRLPGPEGVACLVPRRSNSISKSPGPSSPKEPLLLSRDISRSESLRSSTSCSQQIFRPCDLIHGEVLGKGFFGQAIKVSPTFASLKGQLLFSKFPSLEREPVAVRCLVPFAPTFDARLTRPSRHTTEGRCLDCSGLWSSCSESAGSWSPVRLGQAPGWRGCRRGLR